MLAGDHPVPGSATRAAAVAVEQIIEQLAAEDLVLCPISGGASALWSAPRVEGELWTAMHRALLRCAIDITAINGLRLALDDFKCGGIAAKIGRSELLACIVSDIVGDPLALIGGGPTWPSRPDPEPALRALIGAGEGALVDRLRRALATMPTMPTTAPTPVSST